MQACGRRTEGTDGLCDRLQFGVRRDGGSGAPPRRTRRANQFRGGTAVVGAGEGGDDLPELVVNPERPGRYEPRARKRRPKQHDLIIKP